MWTIVSHLCLVVFVSAHFGSVLSEDAVFPCYTNDTQFRNRTLWARMGGTADFTFCANSSCRVYERINISHPNHKDGWYPQPAGVEETLDAHVIIYHHTATVTIKVNKLQPADFNETFTVTLFAADENGTRINDTSTFFFVIKETDNDTTELTTQSTPLTTDDGDTTQPLTDLRNSTPGCAEQSNVIGRLDMCHVIDGICLAVFVGNRNLTPRDQCAAVNTSHVADFTSTEILKPCLIALLQLSPVRIVRLGETRYIDIRNWTEVHPQLPHRVPCLIAKHQLADPVITWFTLQPWDDQGETILWQHNFLDLNNTSVTIPATNNTLNVTCQASGYPTPEIVILRDNETLEMPDGISLQLNHTFSGEFICQATNVLTSGSTQIRVQVSANDSSPGNPSESQEVVWKIWVIVGVLTAVPTITAVVGVCVFFKKKERRVYSDGFQAETEYEDHEEVVIDNMALYNLGNKEVVIDNMALYNLGNNAVTVDNSAPYCTDKKSIDDTESSNPYEEINEDARNCEKTATATSTSQQKETPVYSKAHANTAEVNETADGAKADRTYSVVIKAEKPAASGSIYSKASSIRATNLAYENVSIERLSDPST